MTETVCDKCKEAFKIELQTDKLDGGIEKTYFACPECGESYTAFCTNEDIRNKQKQLNTMQHGLRTVRDEKKRAILYDKYERLKVEIGSMLKKLKEEVA